MTTHILGGAGFIGTEIASALSAKRSDHSVIDVPHRLQRCASVLRGTKQHAVEQISAASVRPHLNENDRLICLNWSSQPASSMVRLVEDAKQNIIGTVELFTAAIDAGVDRIVFASSGGTVYGNTTVSPIKEDLPLAPVSAYGAAKVAAETYLNMLASTHGITGTSLRVGNPYGPYQLMGTPIGVIANFIRCLREKRPVTIYGDGSKVRDYIAISDVASAFALAITENIPSGSYNIGAGHGISVNGIVEKLENMTSERFEVVRIEDRSFDAQSIVLDSTKFKNVSGWKTKIGLEAGIRAMLEH